MASEFAKSNSKGSTSSKQSKRIKGAAVATVALATMAVATIVGGDVQAEASIVAEASGIAISNGGSTTVANDATAIVIGDGAKITAANTVAIGDGSSVGAMNSVAIGQGSTIIGAYGVHGNIAIGKGATVGASKKSVSMGIAIGQNTSVISTGGIAIGDNVTAGRGAKAGYDPVTKTVTKKNDSTWKSGTSEVAIGYGAFTRQIAYVAAGIEDSDAVNVAQLKAAQGAATTVVANGFNTTATSSINSATGATTYNVNLNNTVDLTNAGRLTVGASALDNTGLAVGTTKVGANSIVTDKVTVVGTTIDSTGIASNQVKVGTTTTVDNTGISSNQLKVGSTTINITGGINAGNQKIAGVAAGTLDTDAVNVSQLNDVKTSLNNTNTKLSIAEGRISAADSKAVAAQSTADRAVNAAVTAESKAVAAQNTADSAASAAATAQNTADSAFAIANTAVQNLTVGADETKSGIELSKTNNRIDIIGDNNSENIVTKIEDNNIAIDLSDAFKAQIKSLENAANGSGVEYKTKEGETVVKIGGNFYPAGTKVDKDGNPVDEQGNVVAPRTDVKDGDIKVTLGDDTPRQIGDVASGLDGETAKGKPGEADATPAITAEAAKDAVGGTDGTGGLLGKTGTDLNNVATIKDLQAVAQAGLDFEGDRNGDVHRPISSKLTIKGNAADSATLVDGNIAVVANEDKTGFDIKLNKDINLTAEGSVAAGATTINKEGITTNKVTAGSTTIDNTGVVSNKLSAGSTTINADGVSSNQVKAGSTTINDTGVTSNQLAAGTTTINTAGVNTNKVTSGTTTLDASGLVAGSTTINADGVSSNQVKVGSTTISSTGITTNGGVAITDTGINAGNKVIFDVADGVANTDAVNVSQLNAAKAAAITKIVAGQNIVVESTVDEATKATTYTVNGKATTVSTPGSELVVTKGSKTEGKTDYSITLSDAFKAQIKGLENAANGSGVEYKNKEGETVVKIGDNFYPAGTKVDKDGNPVDEQGNAVTPRTDVKDSDIKVTLGDDTPRQIGDVASGLDGEAAKGKPGEVDATPAITAEVAKDAVGGTDGTGGLLGKTGTDLNNVATIKDLQAVAQAGLDFEGDRNGDVHRPISSKLTIKGNAVDSATLVDGNIAVVANEDKTGFDIKLNKDINLTAEGSVLAGTTTINTAGVNTNKVTAGTTTLDASGLVAGSTTINADGVSSNQVKVGSTTISSTGITTNGGVAITDTGMNAGNKVISNVANGVADTDAVNVSQLNAAKAAATTKVVAGQNVTVESTVDEATKATTYTVNGKATTVSTPGSELVVTKGSETEGKTDYSITLSDAFKAQIKGLENAANSSGVEYKTKDGETVVKIRDNFYPAGTKVDKEGNPVDEQGNAVTPRTDVKDSDIKVTLGDDTPRQIGDVASGLDGKAADSSTQPISAADAKNTVGGEGGLLGKTGTDLNNVATIKDLQAVAQAGLDFAGDTGTDVHRPLSTKLSIKGGVDNTDNLTDNNIGVVANGENGLTIKLNKDINLTAEGSVAAGATTINKEGVATNKAVVGSTTIDKDGIITNKIIVTNGPVLDDNGINMNSGIISGLKAGEKATDAVNVQQLKDIEKKFSAASGMTTIDEDGDKVVTVGDKQYKVDKDGNPLDKVGNPLIEVDGVYYDKEQVNPDGSLKEGALPADSSAKGDSALSSDASTSGLGLTKATDGNEAEGIAGTSPITAAGAKEVVAGKDGKSGLLGASGVELNKLVTVQDLQAVAQAGVDFEGDRNGYVHRPISSKLTIKGNAADSATLVDGNIAVVANEDKTGFDVKINKDINLTESGSLKLGNTVSLTAEKGLEVAGTNGNSAIYSGNTMKLVDEVGNTNTSTAVENRLVSGTNSQTVTAAGNTITNGASSNISSATSNTLSDGKNTNISTATENRLTNAEGHETSITAGGMTTNGSIVATDKVGNRTTVDGSGISIKSNTAGEGKGSVRLSGEGLDNGGNRIVNIAKGEKNGDAVSYEQLKELEKKFSAAGGMTTVDAAGNKVVTIGDKQYIVDNEGNPIATDGTKLVEVDGKYYNPADIMGNEGVANAQEAPSSAVGNTSLSSDAPTSGLGLNKGVKADSENDNKPTASISATEAKAVVAGADGKTGLLGANGTELNKIVTVQDLQAVAQAGLDFVGDRGSNVHRPLSSTLTITGNIAKEAKLSDGNIGVITNEAINGLEIKLNKDINLGEDGSFKLGDTVSLNGKDGLSIKGTDGKSAVYNGNGVTLKDKDGNSNSLTPQASVLTDNKGNETNVTSDGVKSKDKDGNTTAMNPNGVISKDKDGNTTSMNPDGLSITDKDGNVAKVSPDGISLADKEGNTFVTINQNGLAGKEGSPVEFNDGLNVGGAFTVTPATKDANGNTIAPVIDVNGNRVQNVGNGILPTDAANIGQLESVRSDMKNHSNNVGSMNAALAALNPLPYIGGEKGQIMAGVGVYENKQAVALGYAYTPNSDQQYTLGLSYGEGGKTMANMGATFRIGSGDGATTLAEHIKAQTSKEYETKLAEVKAQSDAQISDLQSQVEELRQLLLTMKQA